MRKIILVLLLISIILVSGCSEQVNNKNEVFYFESLPGSVIINKLNDDSSKANAMVINQYDKIPPIFEKINENRPEFLKEQIPYRIENLDFSRETLIVVTSGNLPGSLRKNVCPDFIVSEIEKEQYKILVHARIKEQIVDGGHTTCYGDEDSIIEHYYFFKIPKSNLPAEIVIESQ